MYLRNMPDLHGVSDISGAHPAVLHKDLRKPKRNLTNDDIDGTKAKPYTFKTTRCVDPNDPQYKLASVDTRPPTPPRFTRDSINVNDIEGACPKPPRHFEPRDSHSTYDIPGAQAGWKPRHKRRSEGQPLRDSLRVDDIVHEGFKTRRSTNPLDPVHNIHGTVHCDGPAQKPKSLPAPTGQDFNLHTEDVVGAYPGWKAPHHIDGSFGKTGRKDFRVINKTQDIRGAAADSKHSYIVTKRVVNPLNPRYQGLDGYPFDMSPPCTPAHDVNRPPPNVREKVDQNFAAREEADMKTRNEMLQLPLEALQPAQKTQSSHPPRSGDPRDAEIAKLRAEVKRLRSSGERPPLSRGSKQVGGGSTLSKAGQSSVTSVDRLVLRSRDGRPRVATPSQVAMAQKRQETARSEAISSVQNLPNF